MKHIVTACMTLMLLGIFPATAGDITIALSGVNPLSVNIRGTSSDQQAGSISIYFYFRDDGVTDLDIENVYDDELEVALGWGNVFRTQEIQTGSWYRSGHTFTRRLYYDNAGIDSLDDYWSTAGIDALICTFSDVGSGHVHVEANGSDGLADWSGRAHTVSYAIPPGVPELHITALSPTQCRLWWHPVVDATAYQLYRSTWAFFAPDMPRQTVAAPDTSYTFSDGLGDPDVTYYFLCRSVGPGGESGESGRVGENEFSLPWSRGWPVTCERGIREKARHI